MNDPVLVVGAGPVGLTLAMSLKRRGIGVRLIDQAAAPTDKSKALVIWPRTLELLDIQGCAQSFIACGMQAAGARIFAGDKEIVHVDFSTARSAYRFALMIPQNETERLLADQLRGLGVEVERQVELKSFIDDGAGVTAILRHAGGTDEPVRSRYLLGCDGGHSTVRHGLSASFEGETLATDWLLADIEIEGNCARDELTIRLGAQGIVVLFPIKDARYRVIADLDNAVAPGGPAPGGPAPSRRAPTLETVQKILDERGPTGLRAKNPLWITHFGINERKVKNYSQGRVFLCGDAAHVHSPAGGQGMNTGMQDAFNLAWKLALVWRDEASPALLDSYSSERSAIGDVVLRNAGNFTKLALIRNPVLQELRSLVAGTLAKIPALRQRLVDQFTEVDLGYPGSPLTSAPQGAAHHPAGGARAPDVLLTGEGGASRLHEVLRSGRFAVLSVGAGRVSLPQSLSAIAAPVEAAVGAAPGYDSEHVYLVRPDAYVMMSTRGDVAPICRALEDLRP